MECSDWLWEQSQKQKYQWQTLSLSRFQMWLQFPTIPALSLYLNSLTLFHSFPLCAFTASTIAMLLVFLCFVSGLSELRNNPPEWNFLCHTFHTTWTLKTNANLVIVWLIKNGAPHLFTLLLTSVNVHICCETWESGICKHLSICICNITKMV